MNMEDMDMSMNTTSMGGMNDMTTGMEMSMDMSCAMKMYFEWSNDACILFEGWHVNSIVGIWLSAFAVIGIGLLREFVLYIGKYYQLSIQYKGPIPFWIHKSRRRNIDEKSIPLKDASTIPHTPAITINNSTESDDEEECCGGTQHQNENKPFTPNNNDENEDESNVSINVPKNITDGNNNNSNNNNNNNGESSASHSRSHSNESRSECGFTYERYLKHVPKKYDVNGEETDSWNFQHYGFDSFLFAINVFIGYCLMLIFMTYNVLLCIAVVLGFVLGRVLFLPKFRALQRFVRNHTKIKSCTTPREELTERVELGKQKSEDHCHLGI